MLTRWRTISLKLKSILIPMALASGCCRGGEKLTQQTPPVAPVPMQCLNHRPPPPPDPAKLASLTDAQLTEILFARVDELERYAATAWLICGGK